MLVPKPTSALLLLAAALLLPACAQDRPTVHRSAAEARPDAQGGVDQLDFFDELQNRPIASNDDAVAAVLLLATGTAGGTTAEDRADTARRFGLLDAPLPPRQAASLGDGAVMVDRLLTGPGPRTPAAAVDRLRARGMLPSPATPEQGMTGGQLLALVAAAQDATGSRTLPWVRAAMAADAADRGTAEGDGTDHTPSERAPSAMVPPPSRGGESFEGFDGDPAPSPANSPSAVPPRRPPPPPPRAMEPARDGEAQRRMDEPLPDVPPFRPAPAPAAPPPVAPPPPRPETPNVRPPSKPAWVPGVPLKQ